MSARLDRLADRIATMVAERLRPRGIVADRVYPPAEAAELIGFRGKRAGKSIREIPGIPSIAITPKGRVVGYLGRDLLLYLEAQKARGGI